MNHPVMLVVLDGFGTGDGGPHDAIAAARTPFFDRARSAFPMAQLQTSGEAVGLPSGQMGTSEVGHMTMGAGRIIDQHITRISAALAVGGVESIPPLQKAMAAAERDGAALHLLGLVSDGGVHSHLEHLAALIKHCGQRGIRPVVHVFLDGRDTPPRSGLGYVGELTARLEPVGGRIATVMGRYYAMDRDNRWERIARAYHAIVAREGLPAASAAAAIEAAYDRGESDEFVRPTVVDGGPPLRDGDAVVFFNFRADRARELTNAITGVRPDRFEGKLERKKRVRPATFVCFTEYDSTFRLPVAFPTETPSRIVGEIVSEAGLSQLRIAETEKYPHVTFFFNNGVEEPFAREDRILIPSPRDVSTYDRKPEMSAPEVTAELLRRLETGQYDFVLLNFANPDMVGHTGIFPAAVKAVETIDTCLGRVADAALSAGGQMIVTADHGNCELMVDPETGQPHTAHTTNPVPIWWVTRNARGARLRDGGLADLAPTLLEQLQLPIPAEMRGKPLIE